MTKRIVFDVESLGLHGEGFAVGWVVLDDKGREIEWCVRAADPVNACGAPDDRTWIEANVVPALGGRVAASFIEPSTTLRDVREAFWAMYQRLKAEGPVELWADCPWPVEARFLNACVDDGQPGRNWEGPYPLLDVGVMMRASGIDAMATYPRRPDEEPAHNPLADARQSARLLLEAESRLKARASA